MSDSQIGIALKNVAKLYGSVRAIDSIDLELPKGKFVCLLGPSGCGKTTLLRLIAGLESLDHGEVIFNGRPVQDIAPHQRNFGMVFQSLALFPHLNVAQNIAYALKIRGQSAAQRDARVKALLELVHLPDVGNRRISQLSGGQRQRIAIARALAIEPELFLLDEPLSALDAKLREAMQIELRQLQKQLKITTLVVTHDQREAMTMADHVVIMQEGKILQSGPPLEIYRKPVNSFVADFIGSSNIIPCTVVGNNQVDAMDNTITVAELPTELRQGEAAVLCIRPEDIGITQPAHDSDVMVSASVAFIRDLGSQVDVMLTYKNIELTASMSPKNIPDIQIGSRVKLVLTPDVCRVLPV